MIVIRPSRLTSPMRVQTFDVPTSIPTRTASLSTVVVPASCLVAASPWPRLVLHEVAPNERHIVEDPEPEVDQCHQVQIEIQPIADERQDHGHQRIRDEP